MSERGHLYGIQLIQLIKTGELKKDYRPNHGIEFTGGAEELHKMRFCNYISSCSTMLMGERLKAASRRGYYG